MQLGLRIPPHPALPQSRERGAGLSPRGARQVRRSVWFLPRPLGERPGPRPQLFVALAPGEGPGPLRRSG